MSDIILLGAGNLGGALLKGWITSPTFKHNITVITKSGVARDDAFARDSRLTFISAPPAETASDALVIIAVKPHLIKDAFAPLAILNPKRVLSVAAGVSTPSLQTIAPKAKIIRAMPSIAAASHQSCTAMLNADEFSTSLFDHLGSTVAVKSDKEIDIATMLGASGSGLLYHFYKAMVDEAVSKGLDIRAAKTIMAQVIVGCAQNSQDTDFSSLIAQIATKGGTTEAMIEASTDHIKNALNASFDKGIQRAQSIDDAF